MGFAPELLDDMRRFAAEHGLRVVRLRLSSPQAPSRFVADLHRWWYRRLGLTEGGLVAGSFILADPFTTLRGQGVPFWALFNTEPAAQALDDYLAGDEPFDRLGLMLFAHGTRSIRLRSSAGARYWAGCARLASLASSERAYPQDFATFARYQPALAAFLPGRPPMPKLTLGELTAFVRANGSPGAIEWEGLNEAGFPAVGAPATATALA